MARQTQGQTDMNTQSHLGLITSGKWVGKKTPPEQGHTKKFQNQEITGKDSICSKQLKLEGK